MNGYNINPINLKNASAFDEVRTFLQGVDLGLDEDIDFTLVAKRESEIIATCSKAGTVIKCMAVASDYRNQGISAELIKMMIDKLFEEGRYHYFVVTKPDNVGLFGSLNFKLLFKGKHSALMEGGIYFIEQQLRKLKAQAGIDDLAARAALVMNCNPFTLGHLHLVEHAARQGKQVILFVVEEDRSVFSFVDRIQMVRKGTAHLRNVTVLPGTEYIISEATFPSYFLREKDERSSAFMEQDAGVFGLWFAPCFGIDTRYVGEEPYCEMTLRYNETLKRMLPDYGVTLKEIPRLAINGEAISASRFRQALREEDVALAQTLVPESTWSYLTKTKEGAAAQERIKNSLSPH
ncbi:MAG: [citrate (pro-3S)-lyase] ligase [Clostridia bacterium]|nr:[citrate (pro-3S)-lyase] ligase [Clostridia bacterium]